MCYKRKLSIAVFPKRKENKKACTCLPVMESTFLISLICCKVLHDLDTRDWIISSEMLSIYIYIYIDIYVQESVQITQNRSQMSVNSKFRRCKSKFQFKHKENGD